MLDIRVEGTHGAQPPLLAPEGPVSPQLNRQRAKVARSLNRGLGADGGDHGAGGERGEGGEDPAGWEVRRFDG